MAVEFYPLIELFGGEIFSNVNSFLVITIFIAAIIGAFSMKLSIAGYSAFLIFIKISVDTNQWIFNNLLYVIVISMIVMLSLRFVSFGMGTNQGVQE